MRCMDPVLVWLDSKGKRIFRNFSFVKKDLFFPKDHAVFNCGKCVICRKKRGFELAQRCVLHSTLSKENMFLTLTHKEDREGYHNDFDYREIQLFKKRFRNLFRVSYSDVLSKKIKYYYYKKVKIFNVHEYGKNGKKHWHLIVFNHYMEDATPWDNNPNYYTSDQLKKLWPYGFHSIGDVTEASAMYQTQYMEKDYMYHHAGTKKKSHSIHSGIGRDYFEIHWKQLLQLGYIPVSGKKMPLPRYFEKLAKRKAENNKEVKKLYDFYLIQKEQKIEEMQKNWDEVMSQYLTTDLKPEFIKSGENYLYDLKKKQQGTF